MTVPSLNPVPRTVQIRKMRGFESARSCLATAPTRLSGLTATSRVCTERSHPRIGPGHLVSAVVAGYKFQCPGVAQTPLDSVYGRGELRWSRQCPPPGLCVDQSLVG